jgi:glycosyltransferase involved in cell wall biosynthesis
MKPILHVIRSLTGGGAERQLALLAHEQAKHWQVHIALRQRGSYYQQHLAESNVIIHELGDLRRGHPLLFVRLNDVVRRVRPALIQTWLLQMDLVGGAIALKSRVPWVLTERTTAAAYDQFPVSSRLRYHLGRHANAIVANSRAGADYWRGSPRVTTIQNAVDLEGIRSEPPARFDDSDLPAFLAVGRLVPQKAHDVLLRAVSLVPREHHFRLVILGDGVLATRLNEQIRALQLGNRVRLLPYQSNWWGALKTATALINASRLEGQPNVVLEAMAAGCPVIVSDIPPHREFLDEESSQLFPVGNARALADALVATILDPARAAERATRAAAVIGQATAAAAAAAYDGVYAQLLT